MKIMILTKRKRDVDVNNNNKVQFMNTLSTRHYLRIQYFMYDILITFIANSYQYRTLLSPNDSKQAMNSIRVTFFLIFI